MPWSPPLSALQQPLGRGRIVRRQDHEVGDLLLERKHLASFEQDRIPAIPGSKLITAAGT
jgi:hypothetical protein